MRNIKIFRLLLVVIFAMAIGSCDTTEDPDSVITSFEKFPVTSETPAVVAPEADEETYTFDFKLDNRQITDMLIHVGVGETSTAKEGVDFELSVHEIDLAAFEGQDGFSIDITVLEDFVPDEGDEKIYLTFTSDVPSGIDPAEILIATINDSGLSPQPGETVAFTLRWEFSDPALASTDICDLGMDLDMTFQTAGTDPYDDDLLEFATSTVACPEEGDLVVADMNDGEVYDVWVMIYAGIDYGDLSGMTVFIDYERENSDFSGTVAIEGVFDSRMEEDGGIFLTIERNGDVLTLKDGDGEVVGEGRLPAGAKLQHVKKRA